MPESWGSFGDELTRSPPTLLCAGPQLIPHACQRSSPLSALGKSLPLLPPPNIDLIRNLALLSSLGSAQNLPGAPRSPKLATRVWFANTMWVTLSFHRRLPRKARRWGGGGACARFQSSSDRDGRSRSLFASRMWGKARIWGLWTDWTSTDGKGTRLRFSLPVERGRGSSTSLIKSRTVFSGVPRNWDVRGG